MVAVLFLVMAIFALTRSGTILGSMAAVPIVLPTSAWLVYMCISLLRHIRQQPSGSLDIDLEVCSGMASAPPVPSAAPSPVPIGN